MFAIPPPPRSCDVFVYAPCHCSWRGNPVSWTQLHSHRRPRSRNTNQDSFICTAPCKSLDRPVLCYPVFVLLRACNMLPVEITGPEQRGWSHSKWCGVTRAAESEFLCFCQSISIEWFLRSLVIQPRSLPWISLQLGMWLHLRKEFS